MPSPIDSICHALSEGRIVPYLGPGVLSLASPDCPYPGSAQVLVTRLTAKTSVPFKLKSNLYGAAQFIENFKHRKTVKTGMLAAFSGDVEPTPLHEYLASLPILPLVVHAWYDDLPQRAFRKRGSDWGIVQGVSQAEHHGHWVHYFGPDGSRIIGMKEPTQGPEVVQGWSTLLYQPFGSVGPEGNFLVSDSDFVEVLTEIDIQTPIPQPVQCIRSGRSFLFLGYRFNTQMDRMFAKQISKRSSDHHWAVLPEQPTKNEQRFMEQEHIERVPMELADVVLELASRAMPRRLREMDMPAEPPAIAAAAFSA